MVDKRALDGEIAKAGFSRASLARKIGITPKTFYAKEKKGIFGSDEIVKIVSECSISEPMHIFFPEFVSSQETTNT